MAGDVSNNKTQIVLAIITLISSIAVAWITTGAKFTSELSSEQESVGSLKAEVENLRSDLSKLKAEKNALINPMQLIGNGKQLEIDKADKRFYKNENCQLGKLTNAVLITKTSAGADVHQPAICACSNGTSDGVGWYCFD